MSNQKWTAWLLFAILALVWGSSFILMKEGARQLTGWQIGSVRIFSAALFFLPFALFYIRKVPPRNLPLILLTGLLGNLFPAFLFGIAIQQKIESSLAGILNSLTPLFVIVIGALFFKKIVPAKKVVGVLIGFAGLLLLNISKGPITLSEVEFTLLILLATIFYGLNVNLIATYLKNIDSFQLASVSIASLVFPSGLVLLYHPVSFATPALQCSLLAVIVLGLLGSALATVLYYALIKKAGGLFASLVTYVIPFVAIFWGLLAGETVGLAQVVCLAIILGGVYLANK